MGRQNTARPSSDYVVFRLRVRMVSFVTLRAFEMALAVSRTRLISKRMSKDSLVVSLTRKGILQSRKMPYVLVPFLKGLTYNNAKIEHFF